MKKNYQMQSEQWSRIKSQGVSIKAQSPLLAGSRWIGLAEAFGKLEIEKKGVKASAIACIQVFQVAPDPKILPEIRFGMTEVNDFGDVGVQITMTLNGLALKSIVLVVPAYQSEPVKSIIVSLDKERFGKVQSEDHFAVVVDSADSTEIVFRCMKWPAGDPIICHF